MAASVGVAQHAEGAGEAVAGAMLLTATVRSTPDAAMSARRSHSSVPNGG
jgi:hypothetical protein